MRLELLWSANDGTMIAKDPETGWLFSRDPQTRVWRYIVTAEWSDTIDQGRRIDSLTTAPVRSLTTSGARPNLRER